MKKRAQNKTPINDEMKPEYDFSILKGAVRGKYAKALRADHNVVIHNEDGTTTVQHFKPEEGAVRSS